MSDREMSPDGKRALQTVIAVLPSKHLHRKLVTSVQSQRGTRQSGGQTAIWRPGRQPCQPRSERRDGESPQAGAVGRTRRGGRQAGTLADPGGLNHHTPNDEASSLNELLARPGKIGFIHPTTLHYTTTRLQRSSAGLRGT